MAQPHTTQPHTTQPETTQPHTIQSGPQHTFETDDSHRFPVAPRLEPGHPSRIFHPGRDRGSIFVPISVKIVGAVSALAVSMSVAFGLICYLGGGAMIHAYLLAAGASIAAAFALARYLSRPIRDLIRSARRVAEGDLTVRIHWQRDDEIGMLADCFNYMVGRIESQQHRLEDRVSRRTQELEKANRQLEDARREAETLARTDSLTGLANRRALNERFDVLLAEARRGRRLALILLDLDRFKSINDHYGHETGDDVLRQVAQVLQHRVRRMDLVARFGGEELAVLLPDVGRTDARSVAETLRQALEDARPSGLVVTASFGVAVFGGRLRDRETLLRAADEALYQAKDLGRNCVVAASPFHQPQSGVSTRNHARGMEKGPAEVA